MTWVGDSNRGVRPAGRGRYIFADCPHVRVYLSARSPGGVRHETVSFLQFGFPDRLHALPA
jgi:hypothetical protein